MNGSHDAVKFWEQHFLKPLAFGMAELRARTGAEHTSPHTQNLLVELDTQMRPTGRVVLRDFDFYIDEIVFDKINRVVTEKKGMIRPGGFQPVRFSLRNGLFSLPSWFSDADYSNWIEKYFDYYKARFSQITGISQTKMFSEGIMKMPQAVSWEPVVDRNYVTGGYSNFHSVFFDPTAYVSEYQEWLDRSTSSRSASISYNGRVTLNELPAPKPQTPRIQSSNHPNSQEPFKTWNDFIAELNRSASLDVFAERLGLLNQQVQNLDLKSRKELTARYNHILFDTRAFYSENPKALLELLEMLSKIEIYFATNNGESFVTRMKQLGANPSDIAAAELLAKKGVDAKAIVERIRNSETKDALLAVGQSSRIFDQVTQSLADAIAFRLKRTTDLQFKRALAFALAKLGRGDITVSTFLRPHLNDLSPSDQIKVVELLDGKQNVNRAWRGEPVRAIENWEEFKIEFRSANSYDVFAGRLSKLQKDSKNLDLTSIKALTEVSNIFMVESKLSRSSNPKAIVEFLHLLESIDPGFAYQKAVYFDSRLDELKADPKYILEAKAISSRTRVVTDLINAIKNGDKTTALKAIGQSSQIFDRVTRSLADAMANRLNRSSDNELDRALIYALAKLGRGDVIINNFLENKIQKLPSSQQNKVAEISNGTRASNSAWRDGKSINKCQAAFSSTH